MNFVLISQKKYNIYHCFSQEQIATNGLHPNIKITSTGTVEASLLESNSDRTSNACNFQSKVCVTTTLAKETFPWTWSSQSESNSKKMNIIIRERKVEEEQEAGPKKEKANILSRNHEHIYLCNLISMIQV